MAYKGSEPTRKKPKNGKSGFISTTRIINFHERTGWITPQKTEKKTGIQSCRQGRLWVHPRAPRKFEKI